MLWTLLIFDSIQDSPIEIIIGAIFLYKLLGVIVFSGSIRKIAHRPTTIGVSCFFGLAVSCVFLPLNHFVGKVVVGAQGHLMKARDERISLMNEARFDFYHISIQAMS